MKKLFVLSIVLSATLFAQSAAATTVSNSLVCKEYDGEWFCDNNFVNKGATCGIPSCTRYEVWPPPQMADGISAYINTGSGTLRSANWEWWVRESTWSTNLDYEEHVWFFSSHLYYGKQQVGINNRDYDGIGNAIRVRYNTGTYTWARSYGWGDALILLP